MSKLSRISPVPGAGAVTGIRITYVEDTSIRPTGPDGQGSDPQPIRVKVTHDNTIQEADRAKMLSTPRRISLTGAVEGEALFDGSGDISIFTNGEIERDYKWVRNKPKINGEELVGDKTPHELGLQPEGEYANAAISEAEVDSVVDGAAGTEEDGVRKYLGTDGLSHFYGRLEQKFAAQEEGKEMSSNDFTDEYMERLDALDPKKMITDDCAMSKETIDRILNETDAQIDGE